MTTIPDLWWPTKDHEMSFPDPGEASYGIEMGTGDIQEFDVAVTAGKRWIVVLPTDAEWDDEHPVFYGYQAKDFASREEAEQALEERKREIVAGRGKG